MDRRIQQLEREQAANPSIDTGARLLQARLSIGEISAGDIRGAAGLGSQSAIAFLGKPVDMGSHHKSFYTLVAQEAVRLPVIQDKLEQILMPEEWRVWLEDVNTVVEAILNKQPTVTTSHFKDPVVPKGVSGYLAIYPPVNAHYGQVYNALIEEFFHEEDGMILGEYARILVAQFNACISVLKSTDRRRKHFMDNALKTTRRTIWYIERNATWPASHEFNPRWAERLGGFYETMTHEEFLEWRMQDLMERVAPRAIERLVGPYIF